MPVNPNTFSLNASIDVDNDYKKDDVKFEVKQTGEKEFSVRTLIDTVQNGFGEWDSDATKTITFESVPTGWRFSEAKFQNYSIQLLGPDQDLGRSISLREIVDIVPGSFLDYSVNQADKAAAEDTGALRALRGELFDEVFSGPRYGFPDVGDFDFDVAEPTQIGVGNWNDTVDWEGQEEYNGVDCADFLSDEYSAYSWEYYGTEGGGTAEALDGIAPKARGTGSSGYGTEGGIFGARSPSSLNTEPNSDEPQGSLDKSLIDAVVKSNMKQIRSCYQRELSKTPELSGNVTIKFVIAKDGTVSSAEIRSEEWSVPDAGQRVGEEICARFRDFQFPAPNGGGIVVVSYPFNFTAD